MCLTHLPQGPLGRTNGTNTVEAPGVPQEESEITADSHLLLILFTQLENFFLTKVIVCTISFLNELESLCFLYSPRKIRNRMGSLKVWADWKPQLRRSENCQVPQNHGDKNALPAPICEHWEDVVRARIGITRIKGGTQCRLQSRCWIAVQTKRKWYPPGCPERTRRKGGAQQHTQR